MKLKYRIYKYISDISKVNNGWKKELNYISRYDRESVYDIRTRNEDYTQYGKGVTITAGEMVLLKKSIE